MCYNAEFENCIFDFLKNFHRLRNLEIFTKRDEIVFCKKAFLGIYPKRMDVIIRPLPDISSKSDVISRSQFPMTILVHDEREILVVVIGISRNHIEAHPAEQFDPC